MQTTLRPADFIKVKRFIDKETREYKDTTPIVRELSSVELYVGKCHITKEYDLWVVEHYSSRIKYSGNKLYLFIFRKHPSEEKSGTVITRLILFSRQAEGIFNHIVNARKSVNEHRMSIKSGPQTKTFKKR